ncbi:11348_t:CDS:2 [Diversispora eburnea]|uniref:11348_t:CDS:1 n=1 Tax=Diversispora eburnea TaxID=1213867 RepID=A0A9N8ZQ62_9GLOM|nr:11348_t:CDS:2 [Diversispora eburnea]
MQGIEESDRTTMANNNMELNIKICLLEYQPENEVCENNDNDSELINEDKGEEEIEMLTQTDVLSTARTTNKVITNVIENNNICITSVDNISQKKKSNKNQPLLKFPSSNSSPLSSLFPGFKSSSHNLMCHLDSPVHEKISLNNLEITLFRKKIQKIDIN